MAAAQILLVEDTLTQALMMQHLLESDQFKVVVVKDGQKALEYLETQHPDLILSDVSMPEIDGYELCKRVKDKASTRDIPFVLLSSFHDLLDVVSIVNSQADSFLLKRFDRSYIIPALQDILAGKAHLLERAGAAEPIKMTIQSSEYTLESNNAKLAAMLAAAFRTTVYLLPKVSQD
jgi:CheY-like chemotaxis protein